MKKSTLEEKGKKEKEKEKEKRKRKRQGGVPPLEKKRKKSPYDYPVDSPPFLNEICLPSTPQKKSEGKNYGRRTR